MNIHDRNDFSLQLDNANLILSWKTRLWHTVVTARVRSTREGNVLTPVCVSAHTFGEGGSQVQVQVGGGVPGLRFSGGVQGLRFLGEGSKVSDFQGGIPGLKFLGGDPRSQILGGGTRSQ